MAGLTGLGLMDDVCVQLVMKAEAKKGSMTFNIVTLGTEVAMSLIFYLLTLKIFINFYWVLNWLN